MLDVGEGKLFSNLPPGMDKLSRVKETVSAHVKAPTAASRDPRCGIRKLVLPEWSEAKPLGQEEVWAHLFTGGERRWFDLFVVGTFDSGGCRRVEPIYGWKEEWRLVLLKQW